MNDHEARLTKLAEMGDDEAASELWRMTLRRSSQPEVIGFQRALDPWLIPGSSVRWVLDRHRDLVSKHGVDEMEQISPLVLAAALRMVLDKAHENGQPGSQANFIGSPMSRPSVGVMQVVGGVYATTRRAVIGLTLVSVQQQAQMFSRRMASGPLMTVGYGDRLVSTSITDHGCWDVLNDRNNWHLRISWSKRESVTVRGRRVPLQDRIGFAVDGHKLIRARP